MTEIITKLRSFLEKVCEDIENAHTGWKIKAEEPDTPNTFH